MKQILIAIDNKVIFNNVIKDERFDFFEKDIIYKEGIMEVLENNANIDTVFINNNLSGEIDFKSFIEKIQKIREEIQIILFLEDKERNYINFLNSKKIYSIYDIEDLTENKILDILENNISNEIKIREEIYNLKNLIETRDGKKEISLGKNSKIIVFTGERNVGKTTLSTICSKCVDKQSKKSLIVANSKDIEIVFKNSFKNDEIHKISENIEILIIEELKLDIIKLTNSYDVIIFDLTIDEKSRKFEEIIQKSHKIFFIVEASYLGVSKGKRLINEHCLRLDANENKFEVIFNNFDKFSLKKNVLKEIFSRFKILGFCKRGKIKKFVKQKILKKGGII